MVFRTVLAPVHPPVLVSWVGGIYVTSFLFLGSRMSATSPPNPSVIFDWLPATTRRLCHDAQAEKKRHQNRFDCGLTD